MKNYGLMSGIEGTDFMEHLYITFNGKFNGYAKFEVTENSNRVILIKSSSFRKISGLAVDYFQNFKY